MLKSNHGLVNDVVKNGLNDGINELFCGAARYFLRGKSWHFYPFISLKMEFFPFDAEGCMRSVLPHVLRVWWNEFLLDAARLQVL